MPPVHPEMFFTTNTRYRNAANILKFMRGDVNTIYQWHSMYNMEIFKIANETNVPIIDITTFFLSRIDYKDFLCDDGVHPNAKGHLLIASAVKDFYEKYQRFVNMTEEVALKLRKEDLRMWKRVQEFKSAVPEAKVEPMVVTYDEIQAGAVNGTIDREMASVEKEYRKQRNAAENACKPTLQEGLKVTACSAALEGLVDGGVSILEHKQERGKIRNFEKEDWKEIGIDTAKGVGKGAVRGAAVYAATNVAHIPAGIASATVTGAFGVIENSSRYIKGECTGKECAIGIADACASAAVSAISTELGRRFIPIPFLGPLIGNAAGTLLYKVAKKPIIRLFNSFMDAEPCIA